MKICNFLRECKTIIDYVGFVLANYSDTRDDDVKLFFYVYILRNFGTHVLNSIVNEHNINLEHSMRIELANAIIYKRINPETIRRTRQKFQEKIPELRGKLYIKRHKEGLDVKEQINKGGLKVTLQQKLF